MKTLKLLNKKYFLIIISLIIGLNSFADEKPIDIWNIEKKDSQAISETNISSENQKTINQNSVYELQTNKEEDTIKLCLELVFL